MLPTSPRRLPFATPFVLHLAYDLADFKLVRAHWTKNFTRKFNPEEPVHALMARVLQQIREDGYVVREYYSFPFDEQVLTLSVAEGTVEEHLYKALDQLDRVIFRFETPALQQYLPRTLLDGTHERHFGSDGTQMTVRFNPALRNYLLNLAQLDEVFAPQPKPAPLSPDMKRILARPRQRRTT